MKRSPSLFPFQAFAAITCISLFVSHVYAQSSLPMNAAASVNGIIIWSDAVEQGIQASIARGQKETPELRNAVLGKLIEITLLAQKADQDGLADTEKANRQLALIRQNYLADLQLSTFIQKNPVIDAEVRSEYDRQIGTLGPKGMIVEYRVSDIAVANEVDAQAALARLKKGESFSTLAKQVSLAPNKVQGGAVGWVQAGQTLPQIAGVLTTLSKGQFSPEPIKMPEGWYLVKLDDKRTTKPPSFEEAKAGIRKNLNQKKQLGFLMQLRKGADIIVR
jgi:peptidyl-prolyl cis-trans isomerase C